MGVSVGCRNRSDAGTVSSTLYSRFLEVENHLLLIIVSKSFFLCLLNYTRGNPQGDLVIVMANDGNWISRGKPNVVYIFWCGKFALEHQSLWVVNPPLAYWSCYSQETNMSYFEVMPNA